MTTSNCSTTTPYVIYWLRIRDQEHWKSPMACSLPHCLWSQIKELKPVVLREGKWCRCNKSIISSQILTIIKNMQSWKRSKHYKTKAHQANISISEVWCNLISIDFIRFVKEKNKKVLCGINLWRWLNKFIRIGASIVLYSTIGPESI